jgi:16S rRNA G966 N2-methylase RsmD
MSAQKTGFYLDQRFQATHLARWAKGRKVLDGFCNQGAFALQAAKAGAASVTAVDISAQCVQSAQRNAEHNKLNIEFHCEDMFDFFGDNKEVMYDMIILDPPPFAKTKAHVPNANPRLQRTQSPRFKITFPRWHPSNILLFPAHHRTALHRNANRSRTRRKKVSAPIRTHTTTSRPPNPPALHRELVSQGCNCASNVTLTCLFTVHNPHGDTPPISHLPTISFKHHSLRKLNHFTGRRITDVHHTSTCLHPRCRNQRLFNHQHVRHLPRHRSNSTQLPKSSVSPLQTRLRQSRRITWINLLRTNLPLHCGNEYHPQRHLPPHANLLQD